jgi:DNA (cytosine-5)-methyltransferase 1
MRYGSVCSGIEAATVAWHGLGWEPQWFAEIEPFPSAVLAHHYPTVPNLGDFTKIGADSEPIDLLVGGTPCQSFSVAGKRLGMDDPRGNLAIEFLRLAYRKRARWFLFENVPGLLSSAEGEDFAAFLSLATGTFVRRPKGGWKNAGVVRSKSAAHFGVCYRILDAQYFGVAQRRRRVFVVGYFGDWRPAAAVLFERESLSGNPPPCRSQREGTAGGFEVGPNGSSASDIAPTLDERVRNGAMQNQVGLAVLVGATVSGMRDVGTSLSTSQQRIDPETETLIVAHPLTARHDGPEDGTGRGVPLVASIRTANTGANGQAIVGSHDTETVQVQWASGGGKVENNTAQALRVNPEQAYQFLRSGLAVRRLTPRECERLQGFPDDYTSITYKGRPAVDTARYRALGNSMAVPCMKWLGERIEAVSAFLAAKERAA